MRTLTLTLALSGTAVVLSAQLGACNSLSDDCSSYRTCGDAGATADADSGAPGDSNQAQAGKSGTNAGGAGGAGGDAGAAAAGAGGADDSCDTSESPRDAACLISDDFAVFVAPDGDDDNAGTQDAPLASLGKAVEVAAGDKVVLVCSGSYDEHVSVTTGARIFGGFECDDWSADEQAPLFKSQSAGPALTIDSVDGDVSIDGLSFEVGDAEAVGETALAALVIDSPHVTLRGVSLRAGNGQAGADGKLTAFAFPATSAFKGNPENPATLGGAEKVCSCQKSLTSTGGLGGTPSGAGQNGSKGLPNLGAGAGGDPSAGDCGAGSSGKKGADASDAEAATGAKVLGTASASGWQPAAGSDGATGSPGQGGGGGASLNSSGHGGGGGCGGCGGNGGAGGKGGGGSIALLAIDSPVILQASSLISADAGKGGAGAAGQPGQKEAGGGGAPIDTQNSCGGGSGGSGAAGGAGGGGAGGISVGIVWSGAAAPSLDEDSSISVGKPGPKGPGGEPGSNDGVAGVAREILQIAPFEEP
jgi:hypothetical protein